MPESDATPPALAVSVAGEEDPGAALDMLDLTGAAPRPPAPEHPGRTAAGAWAALAVLVALACLIRRQL